MLIISIRRTIKYRIFIKSYNLIKSAINLTHGSKIIDYMRRGSIFKNTF